MSPDDKHGESDLTRTGAHSVLPAGTVLAERYELSELIGVGGMGMVYRARDLRLNMDIALKVLSPERAEDRQMIERFERELILGRQVSHPNVVRIHDIGHHGELHFLTMDFVPGRSLKAVLQESERLPQDQALKIAVDLARALQVAHEHGVVHRDLKPANVLVDSEGHAYLTDFGVARSLSTPGPTRAGSVLGTPHYLSPEQALGEPVDGRSDIYALGLLLSEMLTGALPFPGDTFEEALAQRVSGRPSLRALEEQVEPWLAAVIKRCLARDPNDRYPDAGTLAEDLAAGRASRAVHGTRRAAMLGAAAIVALIAIALFFWWPQTPQVQQPGEPGAVTAAASDDLNTIAVVPFADQTGQPNLAWLSTGAAEMLAVQLASSPSLQVVDSLRVFRTVRDLGLGTGFLGETERNQLMDLLDSDRLVMGRVRSLNDRLRIELRLAGGGDVKNFQSEAAGAGQLLATLQDMANNVRTALQARGGIEQEQVLSASPEALRFYTQGVEQLTRGNSLAAVESLKQAVAADPDFAAAWMRLADAYRGSGYGDKAQHAAQQAVRQLGRANGRVALQARAVSAALSGEMEAALELRRELVNRFPNDVHAQVALGELLGNMGRLDRAIEVLNEAVEQAPNHPRAWYLLGKFSILAGNSRRAIDDYLVRALVIQNRLDNAQGKADVVNAMGIAYAQLGETQQAKIQYQQAIELRRKIGDKRGVAAALSNLAYLHMLDGEYEQARARLEEAMAIQKAIGERGGVAYSQNQLGVLAEEQGHYEEALKHFRNALQLRQELGDQRAIAESLNNVGYAYYLLGEYDNAAVYANQALDAYRSIQNQEGAMQARQTLALVEMARGNWDDALAAALAALETSRELEYPVASAVSLGILGKVAYYQGRFAAALESYDQAFEIVESIGDARGMTEFSLGKAHVLLTLTALDAAQSQLEQAASYLEQGGNTEQRADLLRLKGEVALKRGDTEKALSLLEQALETAKASGSGISLLEAQLALGRARLETGASPDTADLLDRALKSATRSGHTALTLQILQVLAQAQLRNSNPEKAQALLDQAISLSRGHTPYAWMWRLQALQAQAMEAQGLPGAGEAYRAAAEALARVRGELPAEYKETFNAQPAVERLDAKATRIAAQ